MTPPDRTTAEEAADDANEAHRDSTDENPSNGQDAPIGEEAAEDARAPG